MSVQQAIVDPVEKGLLIGGEWMSGQGTVTVENPATGEPLAEVADADAEDARLALDAAAAAQETWAEVAPNDRAAILWSAFEQMMERQDELATLLTLEMGKTLAEARGEIAYSADFFRWYSGEALRVEGTYKVSGNGDGRILVMRRPVGPCLLITPWNFPAAMGARKVAAALAAGCTMVWKPAQQTPLSALAMADMLAKCGLPPGVLNVVTGSSASRIVTPLLADPRLRKVTFTGSTEVGRRLLAQAAEQVLKVSMELGGNAPFLVMEDADLDAAVEGAVIAKMRNVGEACTAANRFYVADSVADEFTARFAARLGAMKVADGLDPEAEVGPMIDAGQRDKVAELVEDAVAGGARVLAGGGPIEGPGYFFAPTVLADVPAAAKLLHEEIFGPVAPVVRVAGEDEAVAAANDTEYGLVAYVYTRDLQRALRICERLETGMIGLNRGVVSNAGAPFGGVKQSGLGREGGNEGIEDYLEPRYVAVGV
ncbi:MAG TPA: NAD-dependent succinate-semialdehyde dehydrogenase [Solirubrobacterales bacterium]|nr:NAD-dependent succinate-semialdehyde dehydrogenase [Solirubrobacterales bacterium]